MPTYEVQSPDGTKYRVNAPEGATEQDAIAYVQQNFKADKPVEPAQPVQDQPIQQLSRTDKVLRGMRDPIDGGAQLLTHLLPDSVVDAGNSFNNWLADKTGLVGKLPERNLSSLISGGKSGVDAMIEQEENDYQQKRAAQGETGFDGYRTIGNVVSPANLAIASRVPMAIGASKPLVSAMVSGGVTNALAPVTSGEFVKEKGKQIGLGVTAGGVGQKVIGGLTRIISPKASTNANLNLLKEEGVTPTIGQTLGGRWNALEEKLQSLPIVGDAISNARGKTLEQFNQAAVNRTLRPINETVDGTGFQAVKQAGDKLSAAYDSTLNQVRHITFDQQFGNDLGQLQAMASNLTPTMQTKFNKILSDHVTGRTSPNGSMLGDVYKKVDSELGQIASKWQKSSMASESEFGDAVSQLQSLLNQQMRRSNPHVADSLEAIDKGWANLVRLEGAAKAGINAEGTFTPGQLNMAVRQADKSTRGRSVSRGTAMMQDLSNAGQQVIGNKIPNSFTTDRALIAGGALGSYFVNPIIPASLIGGAGLYTQPAQNLLRSAVSSRPQAAGLLADKIRNAAPMSIPSISQGLLGLLK